MALITDIIVPIIKWIFLVGFIVWILFLIIYGIMKILNKQRRLWIKYNLFKKDYNEQDVAWCIEALEKGFNEAQIRKHLLLKGTPENRMEEICFVFKGVKKQLQGGIKDGRSEESNAKIELPKI